MGGFEFFSKFLSGLSHRVSTLGHVYGCVHQLEAIVDTFETPSPSEKAANRPPINYVVPKISNYVINIPLIVKSNTFITYIHNANAID